MISVSDDTAEKALGLKHKFLLSKNPDAPLVFLVHGRAGNYDVMWTFRRTLPEDFSIIAPQAFLDDKVGGYSWWNVEKEEGRLSDIREASARLQRFIDNAPSFYNIRPRKVLAFGFSQGAGLLSLILQERPSYFSGVALLAGFVIEQAANTSEHATKIFVGHGTQDETIPIAAARKGAHYLSSLGFEVEFHEDPVGHKVGTAATRALKAWAAELA